MSISRAFTQIDVFTDTAYFGNPVAVVLDAQGLDADEMQRFARWTHLSETTFVLPPTDSQADYHVRIFTPGGELPFAGHPTLGTCHAWLRAGGHPRTPGRIVQQCGVGLVNIVQSATEPGLLSFAAPPLRRRAPDATLLTRAAAAIGLAPQQIVAAQLLDNGPVWLGLLLADETEVLALQPDHEAIRRLGQKIGVCAIRPADRSSGASLIQRSSREARAFARSPVTVAPQAPELEVRAFAAPIGVAEDPVTGSLNASLAQWLMAEGRLPDSYRAGQGQCLGRDGQLALTRDASGQVWVGGHSVSCIEGQVRL